MLEKIIFDFVIATTIVELLLYGIAQNYSTSTLVTTVILVAGLFIIPVGFIIVDLLSWSYETLIIKLSTWRILKMFNYHYTIKFETNRINRNEKFFTVAYENGEIIGKITIPDRNIRFISVPEIFKENLDSCYFQEAFRQIIIKEMENTG